MSESRWWSLALVVVLCPTSRVAAQEYGYVVESAIQAAAPRVVTPADLGRPYTALFQSAARAPIFENVDAAARTLNVSDVHISYELIESDAVLSANAGVWGLGGAQVRATSGNAHSVHRVYVIRRVLTFESHEAPAALPPSARYYLSAILYGHMYEIHFHGSRDTLEAGLSAIFPAGRFSAEARRSTSGIRYGVNMRGLEPTTPDAIFATESQVSERFRPTGEPEPILVAYRPIPGAQQMAEARGPVFYEIAVSEAQVRDSKANGRNWDAGLGSAVLPDLQLQFIQGGETVACFTTHNSGRLVPSNGLVARSIAVSQRQPLIVRLVDTDGWSGNDNIGTIRIPELAPTSDPRSFETDERAGGEPMATVQLIVRPSDAVAPDLLGPEERACRAR